MIRTAQAQDFALAVLTALKPSLPAGIPLSMAGTRKWWRIVPAGQEQLGSGSGRMYGPIFAVGAWVPFLPKSFQVRLAAVDVLESIQDLVHDMGAPQWPFPGAEVRARISRSEIRVWFESGSGERLELPPFPRDLLPRGLL